MQSILGLFTNSLNVWKLLSFLTMSSNFDCFVQINGNKYDISIDNFEFSTVFEYIYPKMKQIVEIAENIDIDLKTYDFVVSFIT